MEAGRLTMAPGRPEEGLREEAAEGEGSVHGKPGAPMAKPRWVQWRCHGQGLSGKVMVPTVEPDQVLALLRGGPSQVRVG